ncbi:universal stress protein [Planococcus sp. N028]|uniref:Universal stress protein n=1 Tax=Planococcus shixiaomingii TaxID=3058393 RepID=A0ABT8N6M7_9BACL|nr:universal stress protein [Planococcus sp. N028]MDN7243541.1 universal stress protein [Planococcus sp. N028]
MTLAYKQILVAVDGSKEAEFAYKKSVQIAKRNNATLNLIFVIDSPTYSTVEAAFDPAIERDAVLFGEELLGNYSKEAEAAGVQHINPIIASGSPKALIAREYPKKLGADLIICGATGLNAIQRFLIGSVTDYILRNSPCDVLVVRTEEHAEANA